MLIIKRVLIFVLVIQTNRQLKQVLQGTLTCSLITMVFRGHYQFHNCWILWLIFYLIAMTLLQNNYRNYLICAPQNQTSFYFGFTLYIMYKILTQIFNCFKLCCLLEWLRPNPYSWPQQKDIDIDIDNL